MKKYKGIECDLFLLRALLKKFFLLFKNKMK